MMIEKHSLQENALPSIPLNIKMPPLKGGLKIDLFYINGTCLLNLNSQSSKFT